MSHTSLEHDTFTIEERDDGALWFRVGESNNIVAITVRDDGYKGMIADPWHVTLFDPFSAKAAWAIAHGRDYAVDLCSVHAQTAARAVAS